MTRTSTDTQSTVVLGGFGNNAENLHIAHVQIENTTTNIHNHPNGNQTLKYLASHIAAGAIHNSDDRCDAPKCHPETRAAVQEEIVSWATHRDVDTRTEEKRRRIKWVTGPAGTGKTAILGSVADTLDARGELAASFFFSAFSGSWDRREDKSFITTLAYQLYQHPGLAHLRQHISSAIEDDPAILKKNLNTQLEYLIMYPLRKTAREWVQCDAKYPKVIIVDGLDECQSRTRRSVKYVETLWTPVTGKWMITQTHPGNRVLRLLLRAIAEPAFPFQIIIASRPEPTFRSFFEGPQGLAFTTEMFLDDKYSPDGDIELYLRAKFADIRQRYGLPITWVDDKVIAHLVNMASGQFIHAATVIRWVETPLRHPQAQLALVLRRGPIKRHDGAREAHPLESLDTLYSMVLKTSPDPLRAASYIKLARGDKASACGGLALRSFLESYPAETEFLLSNLSSLLKVVSDETGLVNLYHKSFLDFLHDRDRCGTFYVDEEIYRNECFVRILLKEELESHIETLDALPRLLVTQLLPLLPVGAGPTPDGLPDFSDKLLRCDAVWWSEKLAHLALEASSTANDIELVLSFLFNYAHRTAVSRPMPHVGSSSSSYLCEVYLTTILTFVLSSSFNFQPQRCSRLSHHDACAHWTGSMVKAVSDASKALPRLLGKESSYFGTSRRRAFEVHGPLYAFHMAGLVGALARTNIHLTRAYVQLRFAHARHARTSQRYESIVRTVLVYGQIFVTLNAILVVAWCCGRILPLR